MRKRDVEATVATFGTLICIASEAADSVRVKEAWGWLRASGLEVHVTCANAYLQALIKEVGLRGAVSGRSGTAVTCRHGKEGCVQSRVCTQDGWDIRRDGFLLVQRQSRPTLSCTR